MINTTMWQEIHAQPSVLDAVLPKLRTTLADIPLSAERVLAGGCGDSYYAACALRGTFANLNIPFVASTAQELSNYTLFKPGDLLVLTSISGGTRRTVEAARRATRAGITTLALTCNPDSDLAHACTHTLVLPYEPISRRTPHTLDYTVSLLGLTLVAERLTGQKLETLESLSGCLHEVLSAFKEVIEAATRNSTIQTKIFFLGAGPSRGTAMYGAAKFHEAGGLLAFQEETENFVHGMNYLLEPADIVVLIAPGTDGTEKRAHELATGLKDLDVISVGVSENDIEADYQLSLPRAPLELQPFLTCAGPQMLCFAVAEELRLNIEDDRAGGPNGSIHRTIQKKWMKETQVKGG